MKNLLRITAVNTLVLIGTTSFGQSLNFNGGFTTSNLSVEGEENYESTETFNGGSYTSSYKQNNLSGFNVAIGYEFKLGNRLSLETGLKYQTRGMKIESKWSYIEGTKSAESSAVSKYRVNYLDFPIVLNTAILTGDVRVYLRTGVYVGAVTGGRLSEHYEYSSSVGDSEVSESSEKISGNDMDEYRFTGGLVFGAGVEYNRFYFETNYNVGALSLIEIDVNMYTRELSFSLGYKLKFN